MSRRASISPTLLKLHAEDVPAAPWGRAEQDETVARLARLIHEATGWAVGNVPAATLRGPGKGPAAPPISKLGQRLRDAFAALTTELDDARSALWQREAELASGVPVTRRADERNDLARRLAAVLRGGAQALDCRAAGLYLLDPATTELKLRSGWSLPPDRMSQPPRPLRGAVADLEALAGNAVVLREPELSRLWNAPESYPASLCVPVSSPTTPLGTLWFFADRARDFSERQTELAEIIAGRVAAELDRAALLNEAVQQHAAVRELTALRELEGDLRHGTPPQLAGWNVSLDSARDLGDGATTGFSVWRELHDGRFAIALGRTAANRAVDVAGRIAVRTALSGALGHGRASAGALMEEIHAMVSEIAAAAPLQLTLCVLQPRTGSFQLLAAGPLAAVCQRRARRQKIRIDAGPLIGETEQAVYITRRGRLSRGDVLTLSQGTAEERPAVTLRRL